MCDAQEKPHEGDSDEDDDDTEMPGLEDPLCDEPDNQKKDEQSFKKELPSDNEPEQETDFIDVLNHLEDTDLEEGCPTDIFRLPIPESCPKTIGLSSAYQYAF